jgi:excisionase family DNA binding protein
VALTTPEPVAPRSRRATVAGGHDEAWLTLGEAARYLGVHESTLRRWSDAGRIESRRTAGGHRRFGRFALERAAGATPFLRRSAGPVPDAGWYAPFEEAGALEECRALGQRLAGVVAQFMLGKESERQLGAARELGRSYGRLCSAQSIGLQHCMEAYLYYRDRFLEMASEPATGESIVKYEQILGEVLLGTVEGLDNASEGMAHGA